MFFEKGIIYSYGRHFPIARHFQGVVLFTVRSYSVSTAKHKSYTYRCVAHLSLPIFHVVNVLANDPESHIQNFIDYRDRVVSSRMSAIRSRKYKELYCGQSASLIDEANRYASLFDIPDRLNDVTIEELLSKSFRPYVGYKEALDKASTLLAPYTAQKGTE